MNTTYYKIAYRKKNTGSIIDDTQTPFVALKNSWRYWVADPFVISRMGKTYIFADIMLGSMIIFAERAASDTASCCPTAVSRNGRRCSKRSIICPIRSRLNITAMFI